MKKLLLPSLITFTLFVFSITTVFAQSDSFSRESRREAIKEKIETKLKETKDKLASRSALRKEKLESVKLKVCEQKKSAIVRRSTRLAERAERQLANFTNKQERVDDYYNDKLLPKGIVVENYDDLIADIEAKKTAVEESTASAKTTAEEFDCSGDDPKGQLTNFRIDMQNTIATLKDYRVSIKNLIVAIRTAVAKTATSSAE